MTKTKQEKNTDSPATRTIGRLSGWSSICLAIQGPSKWAYHHPFFLFCGSLYWSAGRMKGMRKYRCWRFMATSWCWAIIWGAGFCSAAAASWKHFTCGYTVVVYVAFLGLRPMWPHNIHVLWTAGNINYWAFQYQRWNIGNLNVTSKSKAAFSVWWNGLYESFQNLSSSSRKETKNGSRTSSKHKFNAYC